MALPKPVLELRTASVGPWPMNTYALVCPATQQSLLIDPGAEPQTLLNLLADSDPIGIVLTHTHADHIGALSIMRQRLNVPLMAHTGPHFQGITLHADRLLADGDRVQVGSHSLRVYHTPGHIDDMICLAIENDSRVIVGDTLFDGGPGRTWSIEGFQTTLQTLRNVVLAWPDDTICYPGHGPHFRLGDRRKAIEAFLAKDHGDFFGNATWDM
jgi:glyoxylase-like metal-dependent hydrolase (beta-lactamase superfamily II)